MKHAVIAIFALALGVIAIWLGITRYLSVAQELQHPRPAPQAPSSLSADVRTADGSLNIFSQSIVPGNLKTPGDPEHWRQNYARFKRRPSATAPGITVYPVYDATPEGVGLDVLGAWEPLLKGLLAERTDARLAANRMPERDAPPGINQPAKSWKDMKADWFKAAVAHSGAAASNRVITGCYDNPSGKFSLSLVLFDPKTGAEQALFEEGAPERGVEWRLIAQQRRAAAAAVDALIKTGSVHAAPPPAKTTLDVNTETSATLAMLNCPDSRYVMEGIDRALQLAALFPKDSLPLQAAAYGERILSQFGLSNGPNTQSGFLDLESSGAYGSRSLALCQLALLREEKPAFARLLALLELGGTRETKMAALKADGIGEDALAAAPELRPLLRLLQDEVRLEMNAGLRGRVPMWLLCVQSNLQRRVSARGDFDKVVEAFSRDYVRHDLALTPLLWFNADAIYPTADIFTTTRDAAGRAYKLGLATEMALTLDASMSTSETTVLIEKLNGAFPAPPQGFANLPPGWRFDPNAKYADLRAEILRKTRLEDLVECIPALNAAEERILAEAASPRRNLAWPGLEFTDAERILYARRRTEWGPVIMCRFESGMHGDFNSVQEIAEGYWQARPDCWSATQHFLECYGAWQSSYPARKAAFLDLLRQSAASFPFSLDTHMVYVRNMFGDDDAQAEAMLTIPSRNYPWAASVEWTVGKYCAEIGNNAVAADHLKRAMAGLPRRYDLGVDYAWTQCKMGRSQDEELARLFAAGVTGVTGDPTFRDWQLQYLLYWRKDRAAARAAATDYMQARRGMYQFTGGLWLASIEYDDGHTTRAMEILRALPLEPGQNLSRAQQLCDLASNYLAADLLLEAEACVREAAAIDNWKASVIYAQAELALAKKDIKTAKNEFLREIKRYGITNYDRGCLSRCLEKEGKLDLAIQLLEFEYLRDPLRDGSGLALRVEDLYVKAGKMDKARQVFAMYMRSPSRVRSQIREAAEMLKDPACDAMVKAGLNDLMAHTYTSEELAALWKKHGLTLPAPIEPRLNPPELPAEIFETTPDGKTSAQTGGPRNRQAS